jgi:hypothetical protein
MAMATPHPKTIISTVFLFLILGEEIVRIGLCLRARVRRTHDPGFTLSRLTS